MLRRRSRVRDSLARRGRLHVVDAEVGGGRCRSESAAWAHGSGRRRRRRDAGFSVVALVAGQQVAVPGKQHGVDVEQGHGAGGLAGSSTSWCPRPARREGDGRRRRRRQHGVVERSSGAGAGWSGVAARAAAVERNREGERSGGAGLGRKKGAGKWGLYRRSC